MKFSEKLKQLRKEAGLTQKQASEILECPLRTFQNWEIAQNEPAPHFQKMILEKIKK